MDSENNGSVAMDFSLLEALIPKAPPSETERLTAMIQQLRAGSLTLERSGTKIIIPENFDFDTAIAFLKNKKEEDEMMVEVSETVDAFPFDGAYAMTLAIEEVFGFGANKRETVQTPFGALKFNPVFVSVEIERGKIVQVPWGEFELPGIYGKMKTGFDLKDKERVVFRISGTIKHKSKPLFQKFMAAVKKKVQTQSIYKGKAIKVSFRTADNQAIFFDPSVTPQFMKLDGVDNPIFTRMTEEQIALSIMHPIKYADLARKEGISLKRTIMLEGDYGTGKTMQANQIARLCVECGFTFLYVSHCEDLSRAMRLAEQYAPCVVFAEDADRVMGGDRDSKMDSLSYVLDGVDTKSKEIMVVLTTNKIETIQQLMIRPGRIDSLITIEKPDAETVYRLMKHYGRGRLEGDFQEFKDTIHPMIGQNAAFITETLKKAELRAISRGLPIKIRPEDVEVAVDMMKKHVQIMTRTPESPEIRVPMNDIKIVVSTNKKSEELDMSQVQAAVGG